MELKPYMFTTLFQFYLSSIKRRLDKFSYVRPALFQFYLSSIKSIGISSRNRVYNGFNSTLVQLKAGNAP